MGRNLYISDLHLDHEKIMRVERPEFASLEAMQHFILHAWNDTVTADDDVWIVGDVCIKPTDYMHKYVAGLVGRKHLIVGNHDRAAQMKKWKDAFVSVDDYRVVNDTSDFGSIPVYLFHYPMEAWARQHYGTVHIHGHTHGQTWNALPLTNRYNCWCVSNGYAPRTLEWYQKKFGYYPDYYKCLIEFMCRHGEPFVPGADSN